MEVKNKTRVWLTTLLFAQIVVVSSGQAVESSGDFLGDLDANEDGYMNVADGPSGPPDGGGPDGGGPDDGGPGGGGPGGGGPGGGGPDGDGPGGDGPGGGGPDGGGPDGRE